MQSLILDKEQNDFSFVIFLPIFVGYSLTSVVYHSKEAIKSKKNEGALWLKERSAYLSFKETKKLNQLPSSPETTDDNYYVKQPARLVINWYNVWAIFIRSFFSLGGLFLHMTVLHTAERAKINFSIILNLYSLTPFLTAILFYIVFKERLTKLHVAGMFLIFGCIAITSESNCQRIQEPGEISIMVPICCALTATCFFTLTNFMSRYFTWKGTLTSQ